MLQNPFDIDGDGIKHGLIWMTMAIAVGDESDNCRQISNEDQLDFDSTAKAMFVILMTIMTGSQMKRRR